MSEKRPYDGTYYKRNAAVPRGLVPPGPSLNIHKRFKDDGQLEEETPEESIQGRVDQKLERKQWMEKKQVWGDEDMYEGDDNDLDNTSGSGLLEGSSADSKKRTMAFLAADSRTINYMTVSSASNQRMAFIPNVFLAPNDADLGTSASTESTLYKPMDRDKRMAYLENKIEIKDADLKSLSNEIKTLADERRSLRKSQKPGLDIIVDPLLKEMGDDLFDMRKRKDRLAAEIVKHEAELRQLINPTEFVDAPVPTQVFPVDAYSFLSKLDLLPPGESRCLPIGSQSFPLLLQRDTIYGVLEAWLKNCSVEAILKRDKESRVLPMTSAPTGSGKTTTLYILCELFRLKWDVSKFMEAHVYSQECGGKLENDAIQTLTSILNDPAITKLRNATDLSRSLLGSTHPCFVGFNSGTPIQYFELDIFGKAPHKILISRVIFAHMNYDPSNWESEYIKFFYKYLDTLKIIEGLSTVLSFFRNRNGCKHILLAVDELLHLDLSSEGIKSSRIQGAIRAIASTVVPNDGIHTIISSLVTSPFEEFIRGSQYTPYFVRVPPLLDNLRHLSKFLAKRRNDKSSKSSIWQLLLSTGGHPKLMKQLIPWLLTIPRKKMVFENAASYKELNTSSIDRFSEQLRRLIFTGGCIPSSDISAICGSSGMLSRPTNFNSIYSVAVPPLVLYSFALNSSKCIGRNDVAYLVPFRMSTGDQFEKFIACWFAFQFQLGRSPRSIFNSYDSESSFLLCADLFNLSKETRLFEFRNKTIFFKSLPNIESTSIELNLSTVGTMNNLFGLATPTEGYRVWVIEKQNNPGFDLMISFSTPMNVIKKVLLVQCLVTTLDDKGKGKYVSSKTFSDALVNCSAFVEVLESNSWEVSFLGLYSCNTSQSMIPKSCPSGVSPAFFERSAAIGNTSMFDLLGDSFGLALELAKGHKFTCHRSQGKKPINSTTLNHPETEGL